MVSIGLGSIQSCLNLRLAQHTTLPQCHEVVNCSLKDSSSMRYLSPVNELVDQMQVATPCALIISILQ